MKSESDFRCPADNPERGQDEASGGEPKTSRRSSLPHGDWQTERAARLHRIFICLEKSLAKGRTLRRSLRFSVRVWQPRRNRRYHTKPGKRACFSRGSLLRLYYQWRRNGKNPQAVALRYKPQRIIIPAATLNEFVRIMAAPGIVSLQAAYRALTAAWNSGVPVPGLPRRSIQEPFAYSFRILDRALPAVARAEIHRLHRARIAARQAERRFQQFLARRETA